MRSMLNGERYLARRNDCVDGAELPAGRATSKSRSCQSRDRSPVGRRAERRYRDTHETGEVAREPSCAMRSLQVRSDREAWATFAGPPAPNISRAALRTRLLLRFHAAK